MSDQTIIEGEIVEEAGTEIVPATDANLFRKDDPVEALDEATRVATALAGVVKSGGMIDRIGDKDYVKVEGWRTLGAILGVSPQEVAMVELENGWQCTVEAITSDGRVVGRATSSCTKDEGRWKNAKTFELQGMASTRATSRALRAPLGFVMQLAGFQATSAEEMSEARDRGGDPDFQWEALPEGVTFAATVHSAKWITAKGRQKILLIAEVKNKNGGKSAGEKLWIDPERSEYRSAEMCINGGEPMEVGGDLSSWAGKAFDLTMSINGQYRNFDIAAATPVGVA